MRCARGILPVPNPAPACLLQGIPAYSGTIQTELCTPTGAALLKHFVSRFGDMPVITTQAIGYGMGEQLLFDEKTGKPLNNNQLDYKLSTIMDHPHLEAQFVENPEPTSAFGTKALGEPPACSGAPAIRNAILNATGVAIDQNPMNAHILFRRFSEEGLIQD